MTSPTPPTEEDNAYTMLVNMLREWSLEALAPTVMELLQQGYGMDVIPYMLQDTEQYKQRFAGNEIRKREGLPVLSPRDYIEVERSYKQIMRVAGIPEGFWDQQSDFNDMIGRDISPTELQRRVDVATNRVSRITDATAQWYLDQYGLDFQHLDRGELVAYVLDPTRGEDVINRVMKGGTIAGAAKGRGVNLTREMAERFGAAVGEDVYGSAARFADYADRGGFLSDLYEGTYDVEAAGQDVFFGNTASASERERLRRREEGTFGGGGGSVTGALGSSPGSV